MVIIVELFHVCIRFVLWYGEGNGYLSYIMSISGLCFGTRKKNDHMVELLRAKFCLYFGMIKNSN